MHNAQQQATIARFEDAALEDLSKIAINIIGLAARHNVKVFALQGDLGAGKTTLARHIIEYYTGASQVSSPTFNLVQIYQGCGKSVWHYDLYRVEHEEELEELALQEALDGDNYTLIEWHEIASEWLNMQFFLIKIDFSANCDKRNITIEKK